jgi:hypothetical protein
MCKLLKIIATLTLFAFSYSFVEAADLQVTITDPAWGGKKVAKGQQCKKFGGNGSTPPMKVTDIPAGTVSIVVEFNDKTFEKLSRKGGHGIVGFKHTEWLRSRVSCSTGWHG